MHHDHQHDTEWQSNEITRVKRVFGPLKKALVYVVLSIFPPHQAHQPTFSIKIVPSQKILFL